MYKRNSLFVTNVLHRWRWLVVITLVFCLLWRACDGALSDVDDSHEKDRINDIDKDNEDVNIAAGLDNVNNGKKGHYLQRHIRSTNKNKSDKQRRRIRTKSKKKRQKKHKKNNKQLKSKRNKRKRKERRKKKKSKKKKGKSNFMAKVDCKDYANKRECVAARIQAIRDWFLKEDKWCTANKKDCAKKKEKTRSLGWYDETSQGKYKSSEKFTKWAEDLVKIWGKLKKNDACECGLSNQNNRNGKHRIVNGNEAPKNAYPWQIAMVDKDGFQYCGGSVLSTKWILSAAHCVHYDGNTDNPKDVFISIGDHNVETDGDTEYEEMVAVKNIVVHKRYDEDIVNNDIALLELDKELDFSDYKGTVRPACLPMVPMKYYGETVKVTGWGLTSDNGKASAVLREVDLSVLWMTQCRNDFKYSKADITQKMICTVGDKKDSCQGDSGGPLVWYNDTSGRYEQIGVVSWGIGCADPKYPGVYTKLSHFLLWIMKYVKDSTFCSG